MSGFVGSDGYFVVEQSHCSTVKRRPFCDLNVMTSLKNLTGVWLSVQDMNN